MKQIKENNTQKYSSYTSTKSEQKRSLAIIEVTNIYVFLQPFNRSIFIYNQLQKTMLQSSNKYENSTLPTILDDSSTFYQEVPKSRPYLPSQITKIRELESILSRSINEKNNLLKQQQQLKKVLEEKVNTIQIILKDNQKQVQQQQYQQNQNSEKKEIFNQISQRDQNRLIDCKESEFSRDPTQRKFYTAMNTPKLDFSDISNTLQNNIVFKRQADKKIMKKSAFNLKDSSSPQALQKWPKTSNLSKQKLRQASSPLNKYLTIEEIWNQPNTTSKTSRQANMQHTYL